MQPRYKPYYRQFELALLCLTNNTHYVINKYGLIRIAAIRWISWQKDYTNYTK